MPMDMRLSNTASGALTLTARARAGRSTAPSRAGNASTGAGTREVRIGMSGEEIVWEEITRCTYNLFYSTHHDHSRLWTMILTGYAL
jgi:hypothetical protein